jgi:hypothetical protein
MRCAISLTTACLVLSLGMVGELAAAECPADSVLAGTVCIDKYEASLWFVPPAQTNLIKRIQSGTVTLDHLTSPRAVAAGVVQLGFSFDDLPAHGCPETGNGCVNVYAVSIPGATPAAFMTWFQAAAAARNALKRLPTNQEWQMAALGTPDIEGPSACNIEGPSLVATGSRSNCVSDVGAFDMVGNLWEWVADWVILSNFCGAWLSGDSSCVGRLPEVVPGTHVPGVFTRGGDWNSDTSAGVFAVLANSDPSQSEDDTGFRCVR